MCWYVQKMFEICDNSAVIPVDEMSLTIIGCLCQVHTSLPIVLCSAFGINLFCGEVHIPYTGTGKQSQYAHSFVIFFVAFVIFSFFLVCISTRLVMPEEFFSLCGLAETDRRQLEQLVAKGTGASRRKLRLVSAGPWSAGPGRRPI